MSRTVPGRRTLTFVAPDDPHREPTLPRMRATADVRHRPARRPASAATLRVSKVSEHSR